ncbi:hypothetical protein V475_22325 [Sphingobium baderi LL03]|uniref:Uncharacterized protein n=1 Tax=Sphingobium baderi LL03 TaxID=1114964 RepID=T0HZC6_9SPHN|nr:hypothetical protein L485_03795 [Sphingobium baderi LL03]KMS51626.1 hypothetical protein V475_22325 [Sphingobium baderi LL03]
MVALGALLLLASPGRAAQGAMQRQGHLAATAAGEAGQRQTRSNVPAIIRPMGRLNSRVTNRVQSRLRNRIDRYYDPRANSTSPFETASDSSTRIQPIR